MNRYRNVHPIGQLMFFLFSTAAFFLGCGAGCSCAKKGQSEVSDSAIDADSTAISTPSAAGTSAFDVVAVGRSYEFGKYNDADKMLRDHLHDSDRTRYLGALIAEKQGNYEQIISLLGEGFSASHSELQYGADALRIEALAKLERFDEALHAVQKLLDSKKLSKGAMRDLLEQMGDFQIQIKHFGDAVDSYDEAKRWAGPTKQAKLTVKTAQALLADNQSTQAKALLAPLALGNRSKEVMNDAYVLLQQHEIVPEWSTADRLKRLEQLLGNKSWDEAEAEIALLEKDAEGKIAKELRWQRAHLLFKRRGHYKEALDAFALVVKDGEPHGDQAAFLSARALSRLDRDEEAIKAFFSYAKKTKERSNAHKAKFYAARLEYYLGKHNEALTHFEALIGNGKRTKRSLLDGGTVRDAHFLAGMSAYLEKKYDAAQDHFSAASVGSSSAAAVARNQYWHAVSRFEMNPESGKSALGSVCQKDATQWYALFAAIRLNRAGVDAEPCNILLPGDEPAPAPDSVNDSVNIASKKIQRASGSDGADNQPMLSLAQMSSKAALYASMGLYRPAAEALNEAEKSKKVHADEKDWILHYLQLDAPQYAIRAASVGLDWDERESSIWQAKTAYPMPYESLVTEQRTRHSLPPFLIYSIARKESLFDPFAVSYVGAMGMMQMMPATYETNRKRAGLSKLAVGALPGPSESVIAGGFELAHLLETFDGNLPLAIMAYNAGTSAVKRWVSRSGEFDMDVFVEKAGFAQTRNYVRRVYQNLVRYSQLYQGPLPVLPRSVRSNKKSG